MSAGGQVGFVRVLVGLALIWTFFSIENARFLSPENLTNLFLQIAALGTMAIGVVFVLLLGEIDLSVGSVSGFAAAVMMVLNVKAGLPAIPAILLAAISGLAIGTFQGLWFTRLRVPAFVVTLAGLLAWHGAQLWLLGDTGTINVTNNQIAGIANTFFAPAIGWVVAAAVGTTYGILAWGSRRRRLAAGVTAPSLGLTVARVVAVGIAAVATVAVLNADRGLPLILILFAGMVLAAHLLTKRTTFGRHVSAIGGNAEAARRAGINVNRVRTLVFGICGLLAAVGGIFAASRLYAVSQLSGSGDVLLNAIAAAVIGGTSLFGGRGSAWSALLGALVIGSISNGLDLLAVSAAVKLIVTAGVLLVAATLDAVSNRHRSVVER
jgi:D-xylose transport system permease protein